MEFDSVLQKCQQDFIQTDRIFLIATASMLAGFDGLALKTIGAAERTPL